MVRFSLAHTARYFLLCCLLSRARGICVGTRRMDWPCSPDARKPMAIATPKPFCRSWPPPMVQSASPMPWRAGPRTSGMPQQKKWEKPIIIYTR